jgi:hypothetical protein
MMSKNIPIIKINELLKSWASNSFITDFTVENVLNGLNLDYSYYDDVFAFLLSRVPYELETGIMTICPENHKLQVYNKENVPEYDDCHICGGDEFEIDEANKVLVFNFSARYLQDFEAEKKKKLIHIV